MTAAVNLAWQTCPQRSRLARRKRDWRWKAQSTSHCPTFNVILYHHQLVKDVLRVSVEHFAVKCRPDIKLSRPTVPGGLAGALGPLNSALMGFQRALQTLLSADGPSAAQALSRVDTILSQSKATYDAALTSIYAGTGVTPALVSLTRFQSTPPANTVSTHPIRLHLLAFC